MKVILPIEYYQVLRDGVYEWDNLGWFAYQEDLARYANIEPDGARQRQSLIDFHYAEGIIFGFSPERAKRYASNRVVKSERDGGGLDRQTVLDLEAAIARTEKNCSS
jgi:hypothetical protein